LKILIGHLSEEKYSDGSTAFNDAVVRGLKPVADLCLIVTNYFGKQRGRPLAEETILDGIPALVVRPRTDLAFDLRSNTYPLEGVAEGRYLAGRIAEYALKQNVDVMHILQWGYLKGCLFEAALEAGVPFVHTPYEYWSVCPQYFLLQYGRSICSGPDESGRKCRDCMNHLEPLRPPEPLPYSRPERTFLQSLPERFEWRLQRFLKSELALKIFGPEWERLFGPTFGRQWDITLHLHALRYYLSRAARILPMNTFWARELSMHLRIPAHMFTVCPPGVVSESVRKLPKGDRFKPPLHFGHPHRVSRETGTFFVLDAWRRSAITADQGVLHIYGQSDSTNLLRARGYDELIRSGSVRVHEERIADRLDEVFAPLAAVISAYTWKVGACGNVHSIAMGIPTIAGRWDYPEYATESPIREGINALIYRRWDAASLAEVLQTCTREPARLEALYEHCELTPGFTHKDFIDRYLRVYENVVLESRKP
jgi:hypothetical protein